MDLLKGLPVILIAGILIYVAISAGQQPPDKGTQTALKPTETTLSGVRSHDNKPEADLQITHVPSGDRWGLSLYAGGLPYQEREQAGDDKWTYTYTRHRYISDLDIDLGAWAGFRGNRDPSTPALDIGIRYSPVRLAWGYISPDLLISPNAGGIGASLYITDAPGIWRNLGVGVAWMADFHDSSSGFMPYVSLSTRF